MFFQKSILIIGGTGTIGQSLIKHLIKCSPKVIRILSRDEYKQFQLQQEYQNHHQMRYLIGDVRDGSRLVRAMEGIDYVFDCAAMKHVPSCEYNPYEAVQTNIIGTQNVIQAAMANGVSKVILTSTDKAISPTNTYGASKLMAERLITAANYHKGSHKTIFAAVRFGNVLGSRGSVVPLIRQQVLEGKEVTLTDGEMTRFMMSLTEATDLLLKAMEVATGGEVFVLKMPVLKIGDLIDSIIELVVDKYGVNPAKIKIRTTGARIGEKMYEELMTLEESKSALELQDMFLIPSPFKEYHLESARPAKCMTYSSIDQPVLSKREINQLIDSII
ncbi:SDR family NAD(P)-dependent oxidoreductase [Paenibacillus qinlingensis]|nr:SDR family NAD(P)-dependent oxidoreductase [Paenibacillus qinlingensis]